MNTSKNQKLTVTRIWPYDIGLDIDIYYFSDGSEARVSGSHFEGDTNEQKQAINESHFDRFGYLRFN